MRNYGMEFLKQAFRNMWNIFQNKHSLIKFSEQNFVEKVFQNTFVFWNKLSRRK